MAVLDHYLLNPSSAKSAKAVISIMTAICQHIFIIEQLISTYHLIVSFGRPLLRTLYEGHNLQSAKSAPHDRVGCATISPANSTSTTLLIPVSLGSTENVSHVVSRWLGMRIFNVVSSSTSGEVLHRPSVLPSNQTSNSFQSCFLSLCPAYRRPSSRTGRCKYACPSPVQMGLPARHTALQPFVNVSPQTI
jgi:hypothetical protein